jgi:hypothetical protein
LLPGETGSGVSTFVVERSALSAPVVVVEVALLFPLLGSPVAEDTVALLLIVPPGAVVAATFTTSVKTELPTLALAVVHVTVPPEPAAGVVHDQPPGDAIDTNVVPAGNVSLRLTDTAGSGPMLLAVIVYVRLDPGVTGSGESVFVTARSAIGDDLKFTPATGVPD